MASKVIYQSSWASRGTKLPLFPRYEFDGRDRIKPEEMITSRGINLAFAETVNSGAVNRGTARYNKDLSGLINWCYRWLSVRRRFQFITPKLVLHGRGCRKNRPRDDLRLPGRDRFCYRRWFDEDGVISDLTTARRRQSVWLIFSLNVICRCYWSATQLKQQKRASVLS